MPNVSKSLVNSYKFVLKFVLSRFIACIAARDFVFVLPDSDRLILLSHFTAVSDTCNMPPAMSKMSLDFGFFEKSINHLCRPLRKHVYFRGFKRSWFVIGGF